MKREASFQTTFNQYLRKKRLYGYFELKQTMGEAIRFDAVEPHQIIGLTASACDGFVWKLSDEDRREKPFDCLSTPPLPGYVVLRYPRAFYIIHVDDFVHERETSTRKSITEPRARAICEYAVGFSRLSPLTS